MKLRFLIAMLGMVLAFARVSEAVDVVTWGTPTNISGDTDVVTDGTLLYAYNFGAAGVASTTVNGVTFTAGAFPGSITNTTTIGNIGFSEDAFQGYLVSYNTLGTGSGAFNTLSAAYKTLLSTGGGASAYSTLSMTLNGLNAGYSYKIQWWLNNSSQQQNTGDGFAFQSTNATAGNNVILDGNVGDTNGNLGQFVTGTFVASSTSAVIEFTGNGVGPSPNSFGNKPFLNAVQLRQTAVPEPGTYALGAIGMCVLACLQRRRQQMVKS